MSSKIRLSIQLAALGLALLLVTQCMPAMGMKPVENVPSQETALGFTSPLVPAASEGMAMMVYPESLESLLNESALIVIGEVGPVYQHHDHIIYSDDGRLLIEGDEKERAFAERNGIAATDLHFTVHEVIRDDGTVARGEPIYLRVYGHVTDKSIEELLKTPPEELVPNLVPPPPAGKLLYLLNPVSEGRGIYTTALGWGAFTIDGDQLYRAGLGEVLQIYDSGPITFSQLTETAKGEEAQFVPRVYRPDPSVTPNWLMETDPLELIKQGLAQEYVNSAATDEERAWREEWVGSGGGQVLREQYELNGLLTQTEPNFLVMWSETSFKENIPLKVTIRVQNTTPDEFIEKHLKDIPWVDLVTVVEVAE